MGSYTCGIMKCQAHKIQIKIFTGRKMKRVNARFTNRREIACTEAMRQGERKRKECVSLGCIQDGSFWIVADASTMVILIKRKNKRIKTMAEWNANANALYHKYCVRIVVCFNCKYLNFARHIYGRFSDV